MLTISTTGGNREFAAPLDAASIEARNAAGEAVVGQLQNHFLDRNNAPNARNWPKRGFWADVLKATGSNITSTSYAVTVASAAFWRRWKGGDSITPKAAKRLAIPAIAEAYAAGRPGAGRVPVDLMVIVRKRAGKEPAVALAEFSTQKGKNVPGRIWYWLVKSANPGADPNAIPPPDSLRSTAIAAADSYLSAIARRRQLA
jgi:hypothetical protein